MKIEVDTEDLCYMCLQKHLRRKGVDRNFARLTDMLEYMKKENIH